MLLKKKAHSIKLRSPSDILADSGHIQKSSNHFTKIQNHSLPHKTSEKQNHCRRESLNCNEQILHSEPTSNKNLSLKKKSTTTVDTQKEIEKLTREDTSQLLFKKPTNITTGESTSSQSVDTSKHIEEEHVDKFSVFPVPKMTVVNDDINHVSKAKKKRKLSASNRKKTLNKKRNRSLASHENIFDEDDEIVLQKAEEIKMMRKKTPLDVHSVPQPKLLIMGTWVECVRCNKWRYLKHVNEPVSLPDDWNCSYQTNLGLNCKTPQEDVGDTEDFTVFNKFTMGSLVWAKIPGWPWWPAMVDEDPDNGSFFWLEALTDDVSHYHVTFLDKEVSRAWVGTRFVQQFNGVQDMKEMIFKVRSTDYHSSVMSSVQIAEKALLLDIESRMSKYSFHSCYKSSTNTWTKKMNKNLTQTHKALQFRKADGVMRKRLDKLQDEAQKLEEESERLVQLSQSTLPNAGPKMTKRPQEKNTARHKKQKECDLDESTLNDIDSTLKSNGDSEPLLGQTIKIKTSPQDVKNSRIKSPVTVHSNLKNLKSMKSDESVIDSETEGNESTGEGEQVKGNTNLRIDKNCSTNKKRKISKKKKLNNSNELTSEDEKENLQHKSMRDTPSKVNYLISHQDDESELSDKETLLIKSKSGAGKRRTRKNRERDVTNFETIPKSSNSKVAHANGKEKNVSRSKTCLVNVLNRDKDEQPVLNVYNNETIGDDTTILENDSFCMEGTTEEFILPVTTHEERTSVNKCPSLMFTDSDQSDIEQHSSMISTNFRDKKKIGIRLNRFMRSSSKTAKDSMELEP